MRSAVLASTFNNSGKVAAGPRIFSRSRGQDGFAVICDAKARGEGYVLGTEDRKFLECAVNRSRVAAPCERRA